jgi:hypothetical protein
MRPHLRRVRHAVAALMGVLLLQLTLVGAGVACTATVESARGIGLVALAGPAIDQGADGHEHPAGHAPTDATTPGDGSGSHHGQTDPDGQTRCPAATGCTTIGVVDVAVILPVATVRVDAGVVAADSAAPVSVSGAPEPPPPRA